MIIIYIMIFNEEMNDSSLIHVLLVSERFNRAVAVHQSDGI